jgi:hypothetical protein
VQVCGPSGALAAPGGERALAMDLSPEVIVISDSD